MDQSRIRALSRFVFERASRRAVVSGTLGGWLTTLAPGLLLTGAARKKSKKAVCKKPKRRCGKRCVNVRKNNRRHCGKCNRTCKPGYTCRRGKCMPPCGKGGPCRVFVSSAAHPANLGGLAGADEVCNILARKAKLPGRYKAWLSSSSGSPATRFSHNPGPYVLTNGTVIANYWIDLIDGNLLAPIDIMENGRPRTGDEWVWTGTLSTGAAAPSLTCSDWTSSASTERGIIGLSSNKDSFWTGDEVVPVTNTCDAPAHLYCFQQR